jgi:hypothetical protein
VFRRIPGSGKVPGVLNLLETTSYLSIFQPVGIYYRLYLLYILYFLYCIALKIVYLLQKTDIPLKYQVVETPGPTWVPSGHLKGCLMAGNIILTCWPAYANPDLNPNIVLKTA